MAYQLTSIIILVYNQLKYTKQCLASILNNTSEKYELVLVDNGSQDNTKEYFASIKKAKIITNKENLGYAKGVNQGIQVSQGEQILLLNNDTIVAQNTLRNLLYCLRSEKKIGIVGPRTNRGGDEQRIKIKFKDKRHIEKFSKDFNHQQDPKKWFPVPWISGYCMLIKRDVVDCIGLMDERFKIGGAEDLDYCIRAKQKGYKLICAGDTFVFHYKNKTFIGNKLNTKKISKKNHQQLREKWGSLKDLL